MFISSLGFNGRQRFMGSEEEAKTKLEWRDYLALVIALLQTLYLPIILLIILLFVLGVFFAGLK